MVCQCVRVSCCDYWPTNCVTRCSFKEIYSRTCASEIPSLINLWRTKIWSLKRNAPLFEIIYPDFCGSPMLTHVELINKGMLIYNSDVSK